MTICVYSNPAIFGNNQITSYSNLLFLLLQYLSLHRCVDPAQSYPSPVEQRECLSLNMYCTVQCAESASGGICVTGTLLSFLLMQTTLIQLTSFCGIRQVKMNYVALVSWIECDEAFHSSTVLECDCTMENWRKLSSLYLKSRLCENKRITCVKSVLLWGLQSLYSFCLWKSKTESVKRFKTLSKIKTGLKQCVPVSERML